MLGPLLLAATLAAPADADRPDAADLIHRLGAEAFDDRVAAIKALEALGADALPALRAATDAGDARVKLRARALIEAIGRRVEGDRFARPTPIRLDFADRPLGEVVDALNARHEFGLTLRLGPEPRRGMVVLDPRQPDRLQELKARAVTVESPRPLPFWEAIDRLCAAGSLRYEAGPGSGRDALALLADRTGRGPVADSGPFRVQLAAVRTRFERDFTGDPPPPPTTPEDEPPAPGELTVALAILAEPGLVLHPTGPAVVEEATDDRGRSLVPASPAHPDPNQAHPFRQGDGGGRAVRVDATLDAPDPPGSTIRRLRGKVPVVAVARGADPLVIPLRGAASKAVSNREMTLVVDELPPQGPGARPAVQVTFRFGDAIAFGSTPNPGPPDFAAFHRDRALDHLELRDAAGRRLLFTTTGQMRGADGRGFYDRYQLVVSTSAAPDARGAFHPAGPAVPAPVPTELRYYSFVQQAVDVPFDFRDVPMP